MKDNQPTIEESTNTNPIIANLHLIRVTSNYQLVNDVDALM